MKLETRRRETSVALRNDVGHRVARLRYMRNTQRVNGTEWLVRKKIISSIEKEYDTPCLGAPHRGQSGREAGVGGSALVFVSSSSARSLGLSGPVQVREAFRQLVQGPDFKVQSH